jgi:hypothetical protein
MLSDTERERVARPDGRWILLTTTPGAPQGWQGIPLK